MAESQREELLSTLMASSNQHGGTKESQPASQTH
jgi:hypothetical protein